MSAFTDTQWPAWKKVVFRFMFIYLALQITPWAWLDYIPGVSSVTGYYYQLWNWMVTIANDHLFHVSAVLVPKGGSGDTSFGWAELFLTLSLAFIGCIIWSLLDIKRRNYVHLNYWLCLFVRYFVAMVAFIYGIEKLFALQMPFPSLHQLATPLGDLLPMRLSWMFIGYSHTYQVFSGIMETTVGLLLIYRRTATLGILMATAVFINVMMLNLSYDIPVKLFSMQVVVDCIYLLAIESNRMLCFFVFNKPAAQCDTYHFHFTKKWMRITRLVFKTAFILIFVVFQFYSEIQYKSYVNKAPDAQPISNGVYAVTLFNVNNQNLPASYTDSLSWRDAIFEDGTGSIKSADTSFRQRYGRGYFSYRFDTTTHMVEFKKLATDNAGFMFLNYSLPDKNTIQLWGRLHNDSVHVTLKLTNRHFQLAEKQFHWLSEHNR